MTEKCVGPTLLSWFWWFPWPPGTASLGCYSENVGHRDPCSGGADPDCLPPGFPQWRKHHRAAGARQHGEPSVPRPDPERLHRQLQQSDYKDHGDYGLAGHAVPTVVSIVSS